MLRLAWRTALRSKGRTALIAVLVGLPVFAGVLVDVIVRIENGPVESRSLWQFGTADAHLEVTGADRVVVHGVDAFKVLWSKAGGAHNRDPHAIDPATLLPPGSRVIRAPEWPNVDVTTQGLRAVVPGQRLAAGDHLAAGMTLLRSGRYPEAADEAAISTSLGRRLGVGVGETVRIGKAGTRVVGIVDRPDRLKAEGVLLPPRPAASARTAYLVDLPDLRKEELHALAGRLPSSGAVLMPRDALVHPEEWDSLLAGGPPPTLESLQGLALGALCVGFGLLEVVLLAGTAFAVGARRQTHDLGLIAATSGGSAKDIRRAVLAQGLVIGLLGATAGTGLALALPVLAKPVTEQVLDQAIDVWPFAPLDYLALIAIGVLSGLAAALVPAIGAARMEPIDALSGRFKALGGLARPPKLAIALLGAGVAAGIGGGALLGSAFEEFRRSQAQLREIGMGAYSSADGLSLPVGLCLLGFTLASFGLVRLMPTLVSWVGALGARLPLSTRLAFRDGSRHRHRTGPAASAIMIAVAASIGGAFVLAGEEAAARASYTASIPPASGFVQLPNREAGPGKLAEAEATAERAVSGVPADHVWRLRSAVTKKATVKTQTPQLDLGGNAYGLLDGEVAVMPPDYLDVFGTAAASDLAEAKQALREGESVVLNRAYIQADDKIWIWHETPSSDWEGSPRQKLAAEVLDLPDGYRSLPPVVVSPETAERLGWQVRPYGLLLALKETVTQRELDGVAGSLAGSGLELYVERGYQPGNQLFLLIVAGFGAFVTLVGVAISVALSASEGRADLATLAAVGAQPRRRRALAAAQALLVGGLGCLLGILLGAFLAAAAQAAVGAPEFTVPWTSLLITAVVIPLFAALCAALFTRSELPMVRRAE
ncbi:hypothetical protein GCM10027569_49710 [Flindersiella endophytica]